MKVKIYIIFFTLFFLSHNIFSQEKVETDKNLDKLLFLYLDGKYEDCLWKSEKLVEKDEYKKNPLIYLYLSMCWYQISKMPKYQTEFPRAFKNALNFAYKYYKKDLKKGLKYYDENKDYFTELKDSTIQLGMLYYEDGNYRKASYFFKSITRFDPNDFAAWLMKGNSEILSRNLSEGVKSIKIVLDTLENYKPEEISASILVFGLEELAKIIKSGEYNKYFETYKFQVDDNTAELLMQKREYFKKFVPEKKDKKHLNKKKKYDILYRKFKSQEIDSLKQN